MQVLLVNGVDFSDILLSDNYVFNEEDIHAEGSGRNPLDALMEFIIIGTKIHLNLTFMKTHTYNERFRHFVAAIKANGRKNQYTVYNTLTDSMITFTGYVNRRSAALITRRLNSTRIRPLPINVIEM